MAQSARIVVWGRREMSRGCVSRVLLAVFLASAVLTGEARAQTVCETCPPPPPPPPPPLVTTPAPFVPPSHKDNSRWYALGGILVPIIGLGIKLQFFPETGQPITGSGRSFPPRQLSNTQLPSLGGAGGGGGGGGVSGGPGGSRRWRWSCGAACGFQPTGCRCALCDR